VSDDEAVRYLLDRAALEDLLCTYARGIDRSRPDLVASVYAEDAHFRSPKADSRGRDAILAPMQGMKAYRALEHLMGNQLVTIDGDAARAETYALAHHIYDRDGAQQEYVMGCRYEDRLVRRADGRWEIAERIRHGDWFTGESLLYGRKG
jgi:ketosteroid isomerase-like protein